MPERSVKPVLLRDAVRGFEGKWVALKDRRVVEARDTADAVYLALREHGIRGATIMRVPPVDEPELVGFGQVDDLRWVYPYVEDPHSSSIDEVVLRPVLQIELLGSGLAADELPPRVAALVDSGAQHTFAAPWLARAIGADLRGAPEMMVGLGGSKRLVRFADVTLRLIPPEDVGIEEASAVEWRTDVGFIDSWEPPWGLLLGQSGFFSRFTVTLSRHAQGFAVEEVDVFDRRFGLA